MSETLATQDVIKKTKIAEYERECKLIADQLILLNTNLFYLQKIASFPLDLFAYLGEKTFWWMTKRAYIDSIILIISRIALDGDKRSLTLDEFKGRILNEYKRDDISLGLDAQLSTQLKGFSGKNSTISKKIKHARNKYIAHLDRKTLLNPPNAKDIEINLSELTEIKDSLIALFRPLCFQVHYVMELWDLNESIRDAQKTDIDRILDDVVKRSYLIQKPFSDKYYWSLKMKGLSPQEIEIVNNYRRKFNLPEIGSHLLLANDE